MNTVSTVTTLADHLGTEWPHLATARRHTATVRRDLTEAVSGRVPTDTSVVAFGSLARYEFGGESDIDWTLLVDGAADPGHLAAAHTLGRRIHDYGREPGAEGTFGSLAFSHELIHKIGGEDDTNSNTTRRILLLLESTPLGPRLAYDRVLAKVLGRYLEEDRGLWAHRPGKPVRAKVPRFLLNDISRYWRTMLVDFAYKQRSRAGRGWALRNIKLRMSRKLIFLSGLLTCFSPVLDLGDEEVEAIFGGGGNGLDLLTGHLMEVVERPPLETVARALLARCQAGEGLEEAAGELFGAYDEFLDLITDEESRGELSGLSFEELAESPAFTRGRRVASRFQGAVGAIFLRGDGPLARLTIDHGIF